MVKERFLFCGLGSVGKRHVRNLKQILPDAEILAFRVRNNDLKGFDLEYGVKSFSDLDEALDQHPRAVFVTNPTSFHLSVAMKSASRGYPLFIEKPLSHDLEGVDQFLNVCAGKRVLVLLGYKMRQHPSLKRMKDMIMAGRIGRVVSGRSYYGGYLPDWHPWEDYRRMYSAQQALGGGIVLDAIHEIDYLYWIMGDVGQVSGMADRLGDLEIDTEDTAEISLRFKSGALGTVHMSYLERPEKRACRIVGTKGVLEWEESQQRLGYFEADKSQWSYFDEPQGYESNQMFVDEMRHFLACLNGDARPNHTLQDAKRVLAIALEAKSQFRPMAQRT